MLRNRLLTTVATSLVLLSSGRVTFSQEGEFPCRADFFRLVSEPHEPHINDCSNKARELYEALKKEGKHAKILVLGRNDKEDGHAIVVTRHRDRNFYMCPTSGKTGWSPEEVYGKHETLYVISDKEAEEGEGYEIVSHEVKQALIQPRQ